MATYRSDNVTYKWPLASPTNAGGVVVARASISTTAALTTADVFQFLYLPAGAVVLFAVLEATDMDTNASPTLAINVGDAGDPDRIFAASTVGQAGTLSTSIATTGHLAAYTTDTMITGAPSANAATGVAGTLYLTVFYTVQ